MTVSTLKCARLAFDWFLGRNRLNTQLYDFADGSVADGIDSNGISTNQGSGIRCVLSSCSLGSFRTEVPNDSTFKMRTLFLHGCQLSERRVQK